MEGVGKCGGRCRDVLEVVWKSVEEMWKSVLGCGGGEGNVVRCGWCREKCWGRCGEVFWGVGRGVK